MGSHDCSKGLCSIQSFALHRELARRVANSYVRITVSFEARLLLS